MFTYTHTHANSGRSMTQAYTQTTTHTHTRSQTYCPGSGLTLAKLTFVVEKVREWFVKEVLAPEGLQLAAG